MKHPGSLRFGALIFSLFLLAANALAASGGLWLDVPYVHQEQDGCGSASVAMVMQYWAEKGAPVPASRSDAAHIQRELYSRKAHGIYASAIEEYFKDSGFEVFAFRGEWNDLREQVKKGRPLVVALEPTRDAPLHFVVLVGISPGDTAALLNDPASSKLLKVGRRDFNQQWQRAQNWTLLAVPKQAQ